MPQALSPAAEAARLVDGLGAAALAKSASYTATEEMLMIAGVAVSVFIAWLMVRLRLLDRIAARLQGWRWAFSTLAIGFLFFVVSDVLRLPWTLFADWHISRDRKSTRLNSS